LQQHLIEGELPHDNIILEFHFLLWLLAIEALILMEKLLFPAEIVKVLKFSYALFEVRIFSQVFHFVLLDVWPFGVRGDRVDLSKEVNPKEVVSTENAHKSLQKICFILKFECHRSIKIFDLEVFQQLIEELEDSWISNDETLREQKIICCGQHISDESLENEDYVVEFIYRFGFALS